MDIGERLKIARNAIGYTLESVANDSGIGVSSISEFENGRREPKFSQLSTLARMYKKSIDYFLADNLPPENVLLWRDQPTIEGEKKKIEAEFVQLCEQYHHLEILTGEINRAKLPLSDMTSDQCDYRQARQLAELFQKEYSLGDIPSASLKQILEEKFCVKIFHQAFSGSAISTVSEEFGPAILLNKTSKPWRRNYDLAHELFHLLTWKTFRTERPDEREPSKDEEKLANVFASTLLLPTDAVRNRIEASADKDSNITFEKLDEIAREFGVSLEALLWRILYLYNKPVEEIEKHVEHAKSITRPLYSLDKPDELPERYVHLAIRALRQAKLSFMQFAKYMGISYKKAQEYLTEDEDFTDEKISIPAA